LEGDAFDELESCAAPPVLPEMALSPLLDL
jgi:hypothetical protein